MHIKTIVVSFSLIIPGFSLTASAQDPLPSWNEGATKKALVEFVAAVTNKDGKDYVKPADRIAVFDNDGTLWVEQPMYTQLAFVFDRVKQIAPEHPEWKTTQPFKALMAGDMTTVMASGEKGLLKMAMATHTGMTAEQFEQIVTKWIKTAKHPTLKRLYTDCVYQPQLELMAWLRKNKFRTFIVSGGGIEFMRPWTQRIYGVSPAQVVGSSVVTEFQVVDGKPILMRTPKINFIDDKAGKPVGIHQHIGQRSILAFGNSDGDMQMLQYTTGGKGRRLGLVVHHTDAEREFAYDRKSHVGKLDKVLDMAAANDWIIVDMKRDWTQVFANEKQ